MLVHSDLAFSKCTVRTRLLFALFSHGTTNRLYLICLVPWCYIICNLSVFPARHFGLNLYILNRCWLQLACWPRSCAVTSINLYFPWCLFVYVISTVGCWLFLTPCAWGSMSRLLLHRIRCWNRERNRGGRGRRASLWCGGKLQEGLKLSAQEGSVQCHRVRGGDSYAFVCSGRGMSRAIWLRDSAMSAAAASTHKLVAEFFECMCTP